MKKTELYHIAIHDWSSARWLSLGSSYSKNTSFFPPITIFFGFSSTAKQFTYLSVELKDYIVENVLISQILNIPDISADISCGEWGIIFMPTKEWLWPFNKNIRYFTKGFQINTSWSNPAENIVFVYLLQSKE